MLVGMNETIMQARPASNGRTTAVLTAFGPFPGVSSNATMQLVPGVAAALRKIFPGLVIVYEILPTDWSGAPRSIDRLLSMYRPDLLLQFGVSSRARGLEIERRGFNYRDDAPDAENRRPSGPVIEQAGPMARPVRVPTAEIVRRLRRRGIAAYESWSAGRYVCNATLYHALGVGDAGCAAGFVHVPDRLAPPGAFRSPSNRLRPNRGSALDWNDALVGGVEIVATCLGRPSPDRGSILMSARRPAPIAFDSKVQAGVRVT
jgi:pyroglutamyl-peptidase